MPGYETPSSPPAKPPAHAVGTHPNTQVISGFAALFMVMSNYWPEWGLIDSKAKKKKIPRITFLHLNQGKVWT